MSTDRTLSICAILVSVLALCISLWQGVVAREHNRLSVSPKLIGTPALEGKGGKNGLYLSNVGLGPAIVQQAKLVVNEREFDFTKNPWPEILSVVGVERLCFSTSWLPVGSTVKSQEVVSLLSVTRADLGACYLEAMKLISGNEIAIEIKYESMYGEPSAISNIVSLGKKDFNFSKLIGAEAN
ncbi:hypothetical protein [Stutzerimonas nitrititolerans]|uniref:hypothetical protein n=1 Tax=Stutzerimonas nitrititolerans TaxID=2482751 RepID=UPI0028966417|nr:hypothetical protein [Stutzerimonas nitrititolerans]